MTSHHKDDWRPRASIANLQARAELISQIRQYFATENVLEVETPLLSESTVTDPHLEAFQVDNRYLQTSPEYAMKRLLAADSGDIYQITKAFRQEEQGNHHNSEFTLLEWYRLDFTLPQMFAELDQLCRICLNTTALDVHRYADLFAQYLNIDITLVSLETLQQLVNAHCHGLAVSDVDDCLTSLFATCIEPNIGQDSPCIVSHFPASQASLARLDEQDPRFALRFELYYKGIELANGFYELTDVDEQASRFAGDNRKRMAMGRSTKPIDNRLLSALEHGLPDCIGVALGIDRLLMLKLKAQSISDVLSFDYQNA